ncbi:TOMM precursor leader peptide-binding protein [Thermogemmatispora sp.]|uniref:TOMM precursor leader peptide-binding protein n=1 Tax=Thermogemmatispora sp. TaxID=1968838 RepID=UPI0035E454BA
MMNADQAREKSLPLLGVLAEGSLGEAVREGLRPWGEPVDVRRADLQAGQVPDCRLLLVICERWNGPLLQEANRWSLANGTPWLSLSIEPGRAVLGPCVLPWRSACATCAELRRLNAHKQADEFQAERAYLAQRACSPALPGPASTWLTAFARTILVQQIAREVAQFLRAPEAVLTCNALLYLDLATLRISRHPFLREPHCPDCAALPADDAAAARDEMTLVARRKLAPHIYRMRDLLAVKERLLARYVDAECGLICGLTKDASNLYANFAVHIHFQNGKRQEVGFGRAFNYEQGQVAAIAEALERYAGMRPGGKRTVVRASRRELGEEAIDPRTLGLHSEAQYSLPSFPYVRYSDDLVLNWVWGYSFARRQPVLVPECNVYYGLHYWGGEKPYVYEISNGCAIGNCLEEALLHGILEIAERDAFLLTWYARLPMPRIELGSARDPLIGLMCERLYYLTGYRVHAFNITLPERIPCFWVMAVDEQQRPTYPRVLCAAGSHLLPEKALINALQELAPIVGSHISLYRQEEERARSLLADSSRVTQMRDHALLYCLPEAFERLAFLYQTPRTQTFATAFEGDQPLSHTDLREDLLAVMARYLRSGIDVIAVDQTTPELALEGFRAVRVLMPGMLPMTFGHHARRCSGLTRLYQLPYQLGYAARPLTEADLNPYPHPFP